MQPYAWLHCHHTENDTPNASAKPRFVASLKLALVMRVRQKWRPVGEGTETAL
jgi:hypothetical protein